MNTNIGIILYAMILSIFIQIKNKYDNYKFIKEENKIIKNVAKNLFTNELKDAIKVFVLNHTFEKCGICNYEDCGDKIFNILLKKSNEDEGNERFRIDENTPLFYVKQKDNNKEYIIYIHPLIIEMIENNEF